MGVASRSWYRALVGMRPRPRMQAEYSLRKTNVITEEAGNATKTFIQSINTAFGR